MFRFKMIAFPIIVIVMVQVACQSAVPIANEEPAATKAFVETQVPVATEAPVETGAPAITEAPVATDAPDSRPSDTPTSESLSRSSAATVIEITNDNFTEEVLQSPEPVLIQFWAAWSGPSRAIKPAIEEITNEYADRMKVGEINVDDYPDLVAQFNINQLPTFIVFNSGSEQARIEGMTSKEEITKMLDQQLPQKPVNAKETVMEKCLKVARNITGKFS